MKTDPTPLRDRDISPCSNTLPVNESNERRHAEHSSDSGRRSTGPNAKRKKPRTRLDFAQKIEITKLLKKKTKHSDIARSFGCGMRTITRIASGSGGLEAMKESPTFNGKAKAIYPALLPEVDKRVLKMIEDARNLRVPVTGDVISSFGRTVKKQMLASPKGISEEEKNKLEDFMASPKWKDNFIKRNGLVSKTLHGEAGDVDHEAAGENDGDHEEKRDCGSPEEVQRCLDCIDEFAIVTDNLLVSHHVREIRKEVARTFRVGKEAENEETVS